MGKAWLYFYIYNYICYLNNTGAAEVMLPIVHCSALYVINNTYRMTFGVMMLY